MLFDTHNTICSLACRDVAESERCAELHAPAQDDLPFASWQNPSLEFMQQLHTDDR